MFSAIKQYFREGVANLADDSDSAFVDKQRLVSTYMDASARGTRSEDLLSGFRKTGIWPIDRKILQDLDALREPELAPGTTPQQPDPVDPGVWATPRNAQDLQAFEDALQRYIGNNLEAHVDVKQLFTKLRHSLDGQVAEIALLRSQRASKEAELAAYKQGAASPGLLDSFIS